MSQKPQPKPKKLELTPEELAKVRRTKEKHEGTQTKISQEELLVAEFGYYYGWEAMKEVIENEDFDTANFNKLLVAGRKVWYAKLVDTASVMYTAAAAAQSGKKSQKVMTQGLKEYIKQSKADI